MQEINSTNVVKNNEGVFYQIKCNVYVKVLNDLHLEIFMNILSDA